MASESAEWELSDASLHDIIVASVSLWARSLMFTVGVETES